MVDSGEFPTYRAVGRVQKDHPLVSSKQVQDALTRLVKQGELRVVRRGVYEATELMRRRCVLILSRSHDYRCVEPPMYVREQGEGI